MSTLISSNPVSEAEILNSTIRISTLDVSKDREWLIVTLNNGSQLKMPLSLYPRLSKAPTDVIYNYSLIGKGMGVHWETPDEDLSLKGFLQDAQVDFKTLSGIAMGTELNAATAKQATSVLRAVNHKLRQRMIALIRDNEGITPTEIYQQLKLEQSIASQHLAVLRHNNIVAARREGKNFRYYLNYPRLKAVNQAMNLLAAA